MKKQELVDLLRAKKEAAEFKDNESLKNIETKEVKDVEDVKSADVTVEALPTEKEVEKAVEGAVDPVVPADAEGVSKNGGEKEMDEESIEKANDKAKNAIQDVVNVTERAQAEQTEVQKELLAKLEESVKANEKLKEEMNNIQKVCKAALQAQKEQCQKEAAAQTEELIEHIIQIGENMEKTLTEEVEESKKNLAKAESVLKHSNRLCNILREGLLATKTERKMVRYESAVRKLSKIA